MKSVIVVLSGSDAELALFDPKPLYAATQVIIVRNDERRYGGYGQVGNRILDSVLPEADVFGIVHADTTFGGMSDVHAMLEEARDHVAGIVGKSLDGREVWAKNILKTECVSTLDSCSLFFPTKSGLRFDTTTFDDFHLCVEDVCLQAHAKGIPVCVPPANANHRGNRAYDPHARGPWYEKYWLYRDRLAKKWAGTPFTTT